MSGMDRLLQACLEDLESDGASADQVLERRVSDLDARNELRPLLAVAERYRHAPDVEPSAEFRQAARARMLALTAAQPAPRRPRLWPRTLGQGLFRPASLARVAVAAAALLLVAAGGGTAALASPPSSPLFGARLVLEEARVLVTPGEVDRLELRMSIADRRAVELEAIVGTARPDEIAAAVERYRLALQGEVEEGMVAADTELPLLDGRLARQEETLRRAALAQQAADPGGAASIEAAIGDVVRERARLRERLGPGDAGALQPLEDTEDTPRPTESAPTTTPEPSPSISTESVAGPGGAAEQGWQQREGWDGSGGAGPNSAGQMPGTPTPADLGQERNRQQGPSTAPTSPPRSATATLAPSKPGGNGGATSPEPGPKGGSTPTGPRPGSGGGSAGGSTGSQSGTSGGRGGR